MLEHPDRYDAVEGTWNVAVITKQEFRLMAEVPLLCAGVRDLQLLGGERNAGDVGAGHLGQIEPKAAQPQPMSTAPVLRNRITTACGDIPALRDGSLRELDMFRL